MMSHALLLAVLTLGISCADGANSEVRATPPIGDPTKGVAPTLVRPRDLAAELKAPKSRPRVYNFWATWCGPCVAEMPELKSFALNRPDVEVIFVNVDSPRIRQTKVAPFLVKHQLTEMTHWQLDDPDPALALVRHLPSWPEMIPVTYVVAASGEQIKLFNGQVNQSDLNQLLPFDRR